MEDLNKIGKEATSEIVVVKKEIANFASQYKVVKITNDYELKNQSDILKSLKQMVTTIEGRRKARVKPLNDYVKSINDEYKPIMAKADEIKIALSGNIIEYQNEQERLAEQERQKLLKEETAKLELEAEKVADNQDEFARIQDQKKQLAERPSEFTSSFKGNIGATSIRKKWKGEVIKPNLVPRNLCSPNPKKIQVEIDSGARNIKGIRIYEDQILTSR